MSFYSLIWDSEVCITATWGKDDIALSIPLYGITNNSRHGFSDLFHLPAFYSLIWDLIDNPNIPEDVKKEAILSIPLYGIQGNNLQSSSRLTRRSTFYSLIWDFLSFSSRLLVILVLTLSIPLYGILETQTHTLWALPYPFLFPYMGLLNFLSA